MSQARYRLWRPASPQGCEDVLSALPIVATGISSRLSGCLSATDCGNRHLPKAVRMSQARYRLWRPASPQGCEDVLSALPIVATGISSRLSGCLSATDCDNRHLPKAVRMSQARYRLWRPASPQSCEDVLSALPIVATGISPRLSGCLKCATDCGDRHLLKAVRMSQRHRLWQPASPQGCQDASSALPIVATGISSRL